MTVKYIKKEVLVHAIQFIYEVWAAHGRADTFQADAGFPGQVSCYLTRDSGPFILHYGIVGFVDRSVQVYDGDYVCYHPTDGGGGRIEVMCEDTFNFYHEEYSR